MIMEIDEKSRVWEIEKVDLSPVLKKGAKLPQPKEMDIIKNIVKDMNANKTVDKIAQRNRVDKALVEEILQIYTTHPGIDVEGILNRINQ